MKTTAYLTVTPTWSRWDPERLMGVRVTKVTAKCPKGPGVVVAVTLDIPNAAFKPLRPVAEIEVALGDLSVTVAVEPPDGDE